MSCARYIVDREYGGRCFLGGTVTNKNILTAHHIIPVRSGGLTILVNLAPLCRLQHDMFNVLERLEPDKAARINEYFMYLKETKKYKLITEMSQYVDDEIARLGYRVVEDKKCLLLKRRL